VCIDGHFHCLGGEDQMWSLLHRVGRTGEIAGGEGRGGAGGSLGVPGSPLLRPIKPHPLANSLCTALHCTALQGAVCRVQGTEYRTQFTFMYTLAKAVISRDGRMQINRDPTE
jgi:hypothetical protein